MNTLAQRAAIVGAAVVGGVAFAWIGAKTKNKIDKMRRDKDAIAKAQSCAAK
jgi:mannose/fructose/N-acetylgalactosamine-specific phosphotransferase system component IID